MPTTQFIILFSPHILLGQPNSLVFVGSFRPICINDGCGQSITLSDGFFSWQQFCVAGCFVLSVMVTLFMSDLLTPDKEQ